MISCIGDLTGWRYDDMTMEHIAQHYYMAFCGFCCNTLVYVSNTPTVLQTVNKVYRSDSIFRNYWSVSWMSLLVHPLWDSCATCICVCSRWVWWCVKSICASASRTPFLTTYTCTYKPREHRPSSGSALPSCSSPRTDIHLHPHALTT